MRRSKTVALYFMLLVTAPTWLYACGGDAPSPTPVPPTSVSNLPTASEAAPTAVVEDTPVIEEQPTTDAGAGGEGDSGTIIGKTGELQWAKLTLNRATRTSDGYYDPPPGMEFIILDVTVENVSLDEDYILSSVLDFRLLDANGKENQVSIAVKFTRQIDAQPELPLSKGEKVTGEIAYEVPKGATGLALKFRPGHPSIPSDTSITINLDQ